MLNLLFLATTAIAAPEPPQGGGHKTRPVPGHTDHGAEAASEHGDAGGGHHVFYTDDDDGDGVPNWRDPMQGSVANTQTYVVPNVGWHLFNFLLLVGAGAYFLRKPIADTFRERALGIKHELTDSARKRDEAHQRHQELLARLERIQGEITKLEQEGEIEAKRDEEKLVERARRESQRIAEQAERNIRDEATRARNELRREAVELAVKLAESTLRQGVGHADHQALARDFLSSLRDTESSKEIPRG